MKFGRVAVATGEGLILAHAVRGDGISLRKGEVIRAAHLPLLEQAGITTLIGARLEADDVAENVAALALAGHVAGAGVLLDRAFTGRCNLLAEEAGLVCVDAAAIDAINGVDEAITVATLPPFQPVEAGEVVATVKIIPFAVPGAQLARCRSGLGSAVRVAPYRQARVAVVSTLLPGLKASVVAKTMAVLAARLAPAGASVVRDDRVRHDAQALAGALVAILATDTACDVIVVFGASAITDRRDVVPVAIELAGGTVEHLGMPVDPGNLLLLGRFIRDGARIPVIGAPGCARSSKENGFDFVLRRMLAGIEVSGGDLRRMGVGGLLGEIATRPLLRQPLAGAAPFADRGGEDNVG